MEHDLVKRACKLELTLNKEQKEFLEKGFNNNRYVWNKILENNNKLYEEHKKDPALTRPDTRSFTLTGKIPAIKNNDKWLNSFASSSYTQTAIDLGKAFNNFYRGKGYPKFKSKYGKNTFRIHKSNFKIRTNPATGKRELFVSYCDTPFKLKDGMDLPTGISTITFIMLQVF